MQETVFVQQPVTHIAACCRDGRCPASPWVGSHFCLFFHRYTSAHTETCYTGITVFGVFRPAFITKWQYISPPSPQSISHMQFQKKPQHFQWEGNTDASDIVEIFLNRKGGVSELGRITPCKNYNFCQKTPHLILTEKDNEGCVEQCSQLLPHFWADIVAFSPGLHFEELSQVRASCNWHPWIKWRRGCAPQHRQPLRRSVTRKKAAERKKHLNAVWWIFPLQGG